MQRSIIFLIFISLSSVCFAEKIKINGASVNFEVRSSKYKKSFDKLNLYIEIDLVNNRLPNKKELAAVSKKVLKNQKKAKMIWVFFVLPKMKSNSGAYATDHRAPEHEGIKILKYTLYNTPYEKYM